MKKNSVKKNWNKVFASISFTLIGAAIGAGIGLAVYWFINHNSPPPPAPRKNLGEPKVYTPPSWAPSLNIVQYPYKVVDGNLFYYYSDDEINTLMTRFKNEVNFGPEIFNLKEISINEYSTLSAQVDGQYIPNTSEMALLADDTNIYQNLSSDEKIEATFEVLSHEYGHHFFYTYVMSPFPNKDFENYSQIYELNGYSYLNKNFYDWFINSFNYEDNSINPYKLPFNSSYPQIGQNYSLDDIFLNSNTSDQKISNNSNIYYGFYERPSINNASSYQIVGNSYILTQSSDLEYLYSMSELLTRKFELSTTPFSDAGKKMTYPIYYYDSKFKNETGSAALIPTIYSDYTRYNSLYYNYNFLNGYLPISETQWNNELEKIGNGYESDFLFEENYYNDDPFNLTPNEADDENKLVAEDFAEHMALLMGATSNYELSLISAKNSITYLGNNMIEANSDWAPSDANKIKLSGYLDQTIGNELLSNPNDSYLAVKEDDGKINSFYPIQVLEKNITYKEKVFEDNIIPVENASNIFWTTKNYINAYDIMDKELYFVYGNITSNPTIHKLTSYRGQDNANNEGYASSWLSEYPSQQIISKVWGAQKSPENGIIIKNIGTYSELSY